MKKNGLAYTLAIILVVFGLITLFLSTSVIFDLFDIRAKEGNYVVFVVWTNFISSILHLFAAFGFVTTKKWPVVPLGISTALLCIALGGLYIHINSGGIFETKTIGAMIFRISVTFVLTVIAYFTNPKSKTGDLTYFIL